MALQLNLLHEQISEQRQRQRDPLKIGMMVLGALGAIMLLFYMMKAYQTLSIKNRLKERETVDLDTLAGLMERQISARLIGYHDDLVASCL